MTNVIDFHYQGHAVRFLTFGQQEHISRHLLSNKIFYELDVLRKVQEIYVPGTAVVDVGANIGNHTVFFAKILGAPVYAFEPNQPTYELLEQNVALNGLLDRVKLFQLGAGDCLGRGEIAMPAPGVMGQAQVIRNEIGPVQICPLDALGIAGPVGLMKIDVEGHECEVLRGATQLLRTFRPDLFIEAATPEAYRDALRLLLPLGYLPQARFAWTPTYLFSHKAQTKRFKKLLATWDHAQERLS